MPDACSFGNDTLTNWAGYFYLGINPSSITRSVGIASSLPADFETSLIVRCDIFQSLIERLLVVSTYRLFPWGLSQSTSFIFSSTSTHLRKSNSFVCDCSWIGYPLPLSCRQIDRPCHSWFVGSRRLSTFQHGRPLTDSCRSDQMQYLIWCLLRLPRWSASCHQSSASVCTASIQESSFSKRTVHRVYW